jgi:hypothetical protein
VPGSNTIQLTDTIKYFRDPQYGLVISLKLSSVVLKKVNSDGTREVYDDWKWTYDEQTDGNGNWTNTIKATIPDGMTFVLEYDYKIIYEKLVKPNDAASCTISNNVELAGVSGGKDSISNKFEWENAGTSAWGKTDQGYVFQKVEKDNFGKQLEGAVFTLYREVDGAAVPVEHNGEIVTYRTGSDGFFTITQGSGDSDLRFEEDTLYYVQETEAPTGYELSDQPEKYYFYFSGNGSFSVSAEKKAVNLSKDTYKAFVENAKVENEEEGVYTLPETGGWGTMLFYVLSTMVLIGSGFLLLRNKYMS